MFVCLYKYSFWNICNLAISHISSLIDGNVLFCFLNFLSLLNLASTFDSELQLREGIYLPTQLNMAHFTTYYNLSSKSIFIYLFQFFYHALLIRELVLPLFFGPGSDPVSNIFKISTFNSEQKADTRLGYRVFKY